VVHTQAVEVLRNLRFLATTTVLEAQAAVVVAQLQPWVMATTTQEHPAVAVAVTQAVVAVVAETTPTVVTADRVLWYSHTQILTQIFQVFQAWVIQGQLIAAVIRYTHLHQDQGR
jgi:hypothetical protein